MWLCDTEYFSKFLYINLWGCPLTVNQSWLRSRWIKKKNFIERTLMKLLTAQIWEPICTGEHPLLRCDSLHWKNFINHFIFLWGSIEWKFVLSTLFLRFMFRVSVVLSLRYMHTLTTSVDKKSTYCPSCNLCGIITLKDFQIEWRFCWRWNDVAWKLWLKKPPKYF